jgi:O-antigen ligase
MKRGQLNLAAVEMIRESPWFGVGLGNFLVKLPEFQRNNQIFWFQPEGVSNTIQPSFNR